MDPRAFDRPNAHTARQRAVTDLAAELAATQPEITTVEIASRRLGIGRSLGFQLAREGRFPVPVIRAGRRLLVPTAALERLLAGEPLNPEAA